MEEKIITLKTAKLAKEKGFYLPTNMLVNINYYNHKGEFRGDVTKRLQWRFANKDKKEEDNPYTQYTCCTQSLLQKWLREEKTIIVEVEYYDSENWNAKVYPPNQRGFNISEKMLKTYEEALEKGLQTALRLIENE